MTVFRTMIAATGALATLFWPPRMVLAQPQRDSLAITDVNVINVTDGSIQRGVTVVIRNARIAEVGPRVRPSKNMPRLDGRNRFLIPGLWDMHVHLSWVMQSALPVLLANGVTGVRDLGSDLLEIEAWRTQVAAGAVAGPRIITSGPILNGRSFNRYQLATGDTAQARGIVRALKQAGVAMIKVHRRVERDVYFAIVDEAKKQQLGVIGHIPIGVRPEEASDAGQAIEHVETLFEGTFSAGLSPLTLPDSIGRFRAKGANALFARFVANNTPVTPTLIAWRSLIDHPDTSFLSDPRMKYVAKSLVEEVRKNPPVPAAQFPLVKKLYEEYLEVVRSMNRAGVTLLAGSDLASARVPGFFLQEELATLVDAGLTPLEALRAATATPARVLGREQDFGAVAAGRMADLVLLDGNPLLDITNTQRINAVIAGGKLYRRPALDALLQRAAEQASRR